MCLSWRRHWPFLSISVDIQVWGRLQGVLESCVGEKHPDPDIGLEKDCVWCLHGLHTSERRKNKYASHTSDAQEGWVDLPLPLQLGSSVVVTEGTNQPFCFQFGQKHLHRGWEFILPLASQFWCPGLSFLLQAIFSRMWWTLYYLVLLIATSKCIATSAPVLWIHWLNWFLKTLICLTARSCGDQKPGYRNQLFPSAIWALRLEFRLSGLAASTLTCQAMPLALLVCSWDALSTLCLGFECPQHLTERVQA